MSTTTKPDTPAEMLQANIATIEQWIIRASAGKLTGTFDKAGDWSLRRSDGENLGEHEAFGEVRPITGHGARIHTPNWRVLDRRHRSVMADVADAVENVASWLAQQDRNRGGQGFVTCDLASDLLHASGRFRRNNRLSWGRS